MHPPRLGGRLFTLGAGDVVAGVVTYLLGQPRRPFIRRLVATAVYLPTVRSYACSPLWALTLPLAGVLYGGMTIGSAIRGPRAGRFVW